MTYLKRNINTALFILVILLVGSILSLTSYYQSNYKAVSQDYWNRVSEYQDVILQLQSREATLNETSTELTKKTQDSQKLEQLYQNVENENSVLESDLSKTKDKLVIAETQIEQFDAQISIKDAKIASLESDSKKYGSLVVDLRKEYDGLRSALISDGYSSVDSENMLSDLDKVIKDLEDLS